MKSLFHLVGIYFCLFISFCDAQEFQGLNYYHISSDQLFQSEQSIHVLSVKKELLDTFELDIIYSDTLDELSDIVADYKAIAGINGGFFNVKEGYSVSYLEKDGKVIALTQDEVAKRMNPGWMLNGVILIDTFDDILLDYSEVDSTYINSSNEKAVLGTGPMLLKDGSLCNIGLTAFSENRHPRSSICETDDSYLFIVVDGRQRGASGMTLFELQQLLQIFHCVDAINLDGGGSSTLWSKKDGILNNPSDLTGERKIANAIILREKK